MAESIQKYQGNIATQGFSDQSISKRDTMTAVLSARAKAKEEAKYIVAAHNPRDMDKFRRDMLNEIEVPGFAGSATEKIWGAAWYRKPIGDGIEGFSIRFAEACMRLMGHIDWNSCIIFEDENVRVVETEVVDFEKNIRLNKTISIEKTVERQYLKKGEVAISTRMNSQGKPVHLRAATEDEVLQKQGANESKAFRTSQMKLVPVYLQSEFRERILQIRAGDLAKDPAAFKRSVVDSFAAINVKPGDLKMYLDHDIDICSQHELMALRDLYKSIRNNETTWHEVLSSVLAERSEEPPEEKKEAPRDAIGEITKKLNGAKK